MPAGPPAPPANSSLIENLAGVIDVMLGRSSGISRIDLSTEGIGWSFAGLAIAGLVDTSTLSILHNGQTIQASQQISKFYFVFGHLVIALIGYAASLIALYLLCRTPQEQHNFPAAIAVHNWAAPIVSIAFLPLIFLAFSFRSVDGSGTDNSLLNLISIFWIGVLIFVGLRLIRISLGLTMSKAVLFFAVTAAVSVITTEGLDSLLGLT